MKYLATGLVFAAAFVLKAESSAMSNVIALNACSETVDSSVLAMSLEARAFTVFCSGSISLDRSRGGMIFVIR